MKHPSCPNRPTPAPPPTAPLPGFTCPPVPPSWLSPALCAPSWVSPALLRPLPGFTCPPVPLPGFHLPSCAPLPGFTCPPAPPSWVSPALLRPLPGFTCPAVSPALLRPLPGFTCPPVPLGFTCPPAPPAGFHLPSCAPYLPSGAPILGFTCPPAPPFLGFTCFPVPPSWILPFRGPLPGFHLPSRAPPSRVSPALPHLGATITLPSHNITKTALDPKPASGRRCRTTRRTRCRT